MQQLNNKMEVFDTIAGLRQYLKTKKTLKKTIGFVPTMGALHNGHVSLITAAQKICDITVCSIFVNPSQFNDPKDLEKYPRTPEADTRLLMQAGCDVLFCPAVNEIYAENEHWHLDIGPLEFLLEGKFRPGHYQGVTQIVFKLFDIVKPDKAFFGQKDYQQFLVISKMVHMLNLPVELVMCQIEREADGLAMSSRNIRLSVEEHMHALVLSRALNWVKVNFDIEQLEALKRAAKKMISAEPGVSLEYFAFADSNTLLPATRDSKNIVVLAAAKVGPVRLIDNVILFER